MISKRQVVEGVEVVTGSLRSGVTVTASIVSSGRQTVVFDTLMWPEDTAGLIQGLKAEGREVVALVDTHWHVDHVSGNQLFTATVLGQRLCPDLMTTRLPEQLKGDSRFDGVRPSPPHGVFEEQLVVPVGDRRIVLMHMPGHTPDSLVGLLEEERVLIAGDTVMELPLVLYGDSRRLIESLRTVQGMDVDWIVQGHGPVCDRSKVAGDVGYLESARRIVKENMESEVAVDEVVKLPIEMFLPAQRVEQLDEAYRTRVHPRNLESIFNELSRAETVPVEQ